MPAKVNQSQKLIQEGLPTTIQTTMSLIVAWQLKNKKALVIGGGDVAKGRVEALVRAQARVVVVAPYIDPSIKELGEVTCHDRKFDFAADIDESERPAIVMCAIDDRPLSRQIYQYCHNLNIPINVADMPEECDFYFGSMINRGSLQIMVSTNGAAPRLAKNVREILEQQVDELGVDRAIEVMGNLRQKLREKTVPEEQGPDSGYDKKTIRSRMGWISRICDKWSFSDIASLTDDQVDAIVDRYPQECTLEDIRATLG